MPDPIVSPESVANGLGLTYPLADSTQQTILLQTIGATTSKVELFLNRSLTPTVRILRGLYADDSYELTSISAYPEVSVGMFDDRYRVKSYELSPDGSGTYDVTFNIGLDVANDPELQAIRDFIREDAATALSNNPRFTATSRIVKSASADGQSITYSEQTGRDSKQTSRDTAGGQMVLTDLKRWRRLPIYQRNTPPAPPWPYSDGFGRTSF